MVLIFRIRSKRLMGMNCCLRNCWPTKIRYTAQKIKFSIKDFFSKCDQIGSFLQIWSYLLEKSVMENFIFCAVLYLVLDRDHYQMFSLSLTLFFPMFHFDPPENIRKPLFFWCFQGDQKRKLGREGLASKTSQTGFKPAQNQLSNFVKWRWY